MPPCKLVSTPACCTGCIQTTYPNSELTRKVENQILRSCPTVQLAGEFDAHNLRSLQFPRCTSQSVDSISTTDPDGKHAKTTGVGCMRVYQIVEYQRWRLRRLYAYLYRALRQSEVLAYRHSL